MPIVFTKKFYTEEMVRDNKHLLFVFGDNLMQYGHGGQAVIRDEPNSFGIPTKVSPAEYFSDDTFEQYKKAHIDPILTKLENYISLPEAVTGYEAVVFPIDFIGTGLADLPNKSPIMMHYLTHRVNVLMHIYGVEPEEDYFND